MPHPSPDSPGGLPPGGGFTGLVGQLFAYIDRPWKAVVVVVLLVVGGVGYVLYEQRDELLESWMTPSEVSLKVTEVTPSLEKLTQDTSADLVQIWSVDLGINAQRFLGARRHDGDRPVIPDPRRLPIIVHSSDLRIITEILEGHPACLEMTKQGTPFAARLADRGFTFGCAIPIPPGPSAFVGMIYLAWVTRPEKSEETVAVAAAREIAGKLITR